VSEPESEYSVLVPPELEAGVYANLLQTLHSEHEFTLDFCVAIVPEEDPADVPYRVVSRIRLPVTLIFDTLRRLNDAMTRYEQRFGEIVEEGQP
jgi:hypothetical protein